MMLCAVLLPSLSPFSKCVYEHGSLNQYKNKSRQMQHLSFLSCYFIIQKGSEKKEKNKGSSQGQKLFRPYESSPRKVRIEQDTICTQSPPLFRTSPPNRRLEKTSQ
ncbi:hypothetical protein B0J11DRAFT_10977 [Dendryphion nanum]|uniref:Secreted protein n=1 Tax=Dendryphion nanum TaxID=256645 RepID=A0A9P9EF09_9PLEO|nr:hypothetical protein B0J11DRAFT_10977 [Dendryphion nanum]